MSISPLQVRHQRVELPGILGLLSFATSIVAILLMPGPTSAWALIFGAGAVGLALLSRRALRRSGRGRGWVLAIPGFLLGGTALLVTGLAYIVSFALAIG